MNIHKEAGIFFLLAGTQAPINGSVWVHKDREGRKRPQGTHIMAAQFVQQVNWLQIYHK
jgi:hypothetical protein